MKLRTSPDSSALAHRRYSGAVLLDADGLALLQERDRSPGIVNPGMLTLFGGTAEDGEGFAACMVRELVEELELAINDSNLASLGYVDKREDDGSLTQCALYVVAGIQADSLILHEGRAIARRPVEQYLDDPLVSMVARIALEAAQRRCGEDA